MTHIHFNIKRVYEPAASEDGLRVLVDRLWPRGLKKEAAQLDSWMRDVAPSPELRKWFCHRPERFGEFAALYEQELTTDPVHQELVKELTEQAAKGAVTLLYAAKDPVYNHAVVLHRVLTERMNWRRMR